METSALLHAAYFAGRFNASEQQKLLRPEGPTGKRLNL